VHKNKASGFIFAPEKHVEMRMWYYRQHLLNLVTRYPLVS